MPEKSNILADGTVSFSGGMDSSRSPESINPNQYARAANLFIPRTNGNRLAVRPGLHCQFIEWDNQRSREIYENGVIQGAGWYIDRGNLVLLKAVDGSIFSFAKFSEGRFYARLHHGFRVRSNAARVYFSRIPNGAIINDGYSSPLMITNQQVTRLNGNQQIRPGTFGVYAFGRFFYSTDNNRRIEASNYNQPWDLSNAYNTNIFGPVVPEQNEEFSALGIIKSVSNEVKGGSLAISTSDSIYSLDPRGDRQHWEELSTERGKLQEVLTGIGIIGSNALDSFNTNLWFRTSIGLSGLKQTRSQFIDDDEYSSQSIEVDNWLSVDDAKLLSNCYVRNYRGRLFVTIAPEIKDGGVFWNAMVTMNPSPTYANKAKAPRRFEGLVLGVRPWAITTTNLSNSYPELYIDSYDGDGKNRLYKMVDDSDYDLDEFENKIPIKFWLETRSFDFKAPLTLKSTKFKGYSIDGLTDDLRLNFFSRENGSGAWRHFHEAIHLVGSKQGELTSASPQFRDCVLPDERDSKEEITMPNSSFPNYYHSAMRIEGCGPVEIKSFRVISTPKSTELSASIPETEGFDYEPSERKDFNYLIHE